jgi:hypothetical protein
MRLARVLDLFLKKLIVISKIFSARGPILKAAGARLAENQKVEGLKTSLANVAGRAVRASWRRP